MELKEGMIIECRNGHRYLLRKVDDNLIGSNNTGYIGIDYDKDLNENKYCQEDFDIMKIYESKAYVLEDLFDDNYL